MSRLEQLIGRLRTFYGLLPPPPRDPFQLFIWEVFTTHTTPRKRDAGMAALRKLRALTPDSMWRAPAKHLEEVVAIVGPYREQRIEALRTGAGIFRSAPDLPKVIRGPLPAARKALKGIPQMGEGGAYRMLLFAADHPVLPIDARVSRVAQRLGYGSPGRSFSTTARSIRDAVARELPSTLAVYRHAYSYLAHHGMNTCTERTPHCSVCPLVKDCPEGQKRMADG